MRQPGGESREERAGRRKSGEEAAGCRSWESRWEAGLRRCLHGNDAAPTRVTVGAASSGVSVGAFHQAVPSGLSLESLGVGVTCGVGAA